MEFYDGNKRRIALRSEQRNEQRQITSEFYPCVKFARRLFVHSGLSRLSVPSSRASWIFYPEEAVKATLWSCPYIEIVDLNENQSDESVTRKAFTPGLPRSAIHCWIALFYYCSLNFVRLKCLGFSPCVSAKCEKTFAECPTSDYWISRIGRDDWWPNVSISCIFVSFFQFFVFFQFQPNRAATVSMSLAGGTWEVRRGRVTVTPTSAKRRVPEPSHEV